MQELCKKILGIMLLMSPQLWGADAVDSLAQALQSIAAKTEKVGIEESTSFTQAENLKTIKDIEALKKQLPLPAIGINNDVWRSIISAALGRFQGRYANNQSALDALKIFLTRALTTGTNIIDNIKSMHEKLKATPAQYGFTQDSIRMNALKSDLVKLDDLYREANNVAEKDILQAMVGALRDILGPLKYMVGNKPHEILNIAENASGNQVTSAASSLRDMYKGKPSEYAVEPFISDAFAHMFGLVKPKAPVKPTYLAAVEKIKTDISQLPLASIGINNDAWRSIISAALAHFNEQYANDKSSLDALKLILSRALTAGTNVINNIKSMHEKVQASQWGVSQDSIRMNDLKSNLNTLDAIYNEAENSKEKIVLQTMVDALRDILAPVKTIAGKTSYGILGLAEGASTSQVSSAAAAMRDKYQGTQSEYVVEPFTKDAAGIIFTGWQPAGKQEPAPKVSTNETGYGEKFQMMPRIAARATALMGSPNDTIWERGFTEEQEDNWYKSLDELGAYIKKRDVGKASGSNLQTFNDAQQNLKRWSSDLFNAVQIVYNTKNKTQTQRETVQKIVQEIGAFKPKLASTWTDYQSTKEIKQTLLEFVEVLEGIANKALNNF